MTRDVKASAAFRRYDKDKNNKLDKDEVVLMLRENNLLDQFQAGPPGLIDAVVRAIAHKGPGTASYHLSPSPRLRPCVAWQGSKEMGGHPATQLRRLCPGDVRASGGSVLLVPMITLCTGDLEECVRGGLKP